MKKIVVGFIVIVSMLLFNSCTDNSLEEIENREQKIQLIDHSEVGDENNEDEEEGSR
ncbi:conserved hypothetical protein [Tenacibaculum sp. 190524A02b]|uniref:Lipoprotein n=1 Tax=Tenacibaculum vairaonense TaxID=3137860 RepID=A0ABP1FE70_9FLAO